MTRSVLLRHAALPLAVLLLFASCALLILAGLSRDLDRALATARGAPFPALPIHLLQTLAPLSAPSNDASAQGEPAAFQPTLAHRLAACLPSASNRGLSAHIERAAFPLLLSFRYNRVQLLAHFLNRARFGSLHGRPVYGLTRASEAYFDLRPSRLTLGESALLLDLALHPGEPTPLDNPDAALNRRERLLAVLNAAGTLSEARYRAETRLPLSLPPDPRPIW